MIISIDDFVKMDPTTVSQGYASTTTGEVKSLRDSEYKNAPISIGKKAPNIISLDKNSIDSKILFGSSEHIRKDIQKLADQKGLVLKPTQLAAAEFLLKNRDVACFQPTGFGKTLPVFLATQLARSSSPKLTVGIFPINALVQDMYRRCCDFGLRAAIWNSTVTNKDGILADIAAGKLDILLTTMESLQSDRLTSKLFGNVGLAWVDEVHTTRDSNFRVAWGKSALTLARLQPEVRYVCTATLSAADQDELFATCGLIDPKVIRMSPDRDNLHYHQISRSPEALRSVFLKHNGGRILVYTATRRASQNLASAFQSYGFKACAYHGELSKSARNQAQLDFSSGKHNIMFCTDSFGLGVDVANVKAVVCYDPAASIDDFVQQAGRAGRDGSPADVYLCIYNSHEGWNSRRYLLETSYPEVRDLRKVKDYILRKGDVGASGTPVDVVGKAGIPTNAYRAKAMIDWLTRHKLVEPIEIGSGTEYRSNVEAERIDWAGYSDRRLRALDQLEQLKTLWSLPSTEIRGKIIEYFESDVSEHRDTRRIITDNELSPGGHFEVTDEEAREQAQIPSPMNEDESECLELA